MTPFDFQPRTRLLFGPGRIESLGELAAELGAKRVMVVSDPGIVAAGHDDRGLYSLRQVGLQAVLYQGVVQNPTTESVEHGCEFARDFRPDVLVGLGGGSSMDCAKGINFLYTNGGQMRDYWGIGKAKKPMLPMIAVPTTAGTGSEAQSFALISDAKTHVKMACGDPKAACRVAVLDPELTVTQPPRVTALTGIDAIAHAVETFVTNRRNPISLAFSREAWRLLAPHYPRVLEDGNDLSARGAMQLGAFFAGLAIENSMLGAAHALANPLTQFFEIVHGQAVAVMLPHVVRFNGDVADEAYRELLCTLCESNGQTQHNRPSDALAERLHTLLQQAGLATSLQQLGVPREKLEDLAAAAATQWTAQFNPRLVAADDLLRLYEAAYD